MYCEACQTWVNNLTHFVIHDGEVYCKEVILSEYDSVEEFFGEQDFPAWFVEQQNGGVYGG